MTAIRHLVALGLALGALAIATPAVLADSVITVTGLSSQVGNDGLCTLSEAITASNTDTASGAANGECAAGDTGQDTIVFSITGSIGLTADLPVITGLTVIDGGDDDDPNLSINGFGHRVFVLGAASDVELQDLDLRGGLSATGGAVEVQGVARIVSSRILQNGATVSGGGVHVGATGVLAVLESSIAGNEAPTGAGIFVAAGGDLEVKQAAITNNTATGNGGGIATASKTTLANVTLARNNAVNGGAVSATGGVLKILHATIVENGATGEGGGLSLGGGVTSSTVGNSIVSDNVATPDPDVDGSITTSVANLVGVDTTNLLDVIPDDNGGPTPTIRLLPTAAAAIDAGDDDICADGAVNLVDQRGLARGDAGCDIGAYERDSVAPVIDAGPAVVLSEGSRLSGSKPSVVVEWAGHDDGGFGSIAYTLEGSVDGGPWIEVGFTEATSSVVVVPKDARVRFRVTPVDFDENLGTPAVSPSFRTKLVQQTASGVRFKGTWRSSSDAAYSGGSVRRSTQRSASAKYEFTGKGIAFVTTQADNRGQARIYINGNLQATIDLSDPTRYRVLAWQRTWASSATRTIKVVVVGTSGRPRVDVDAFVVLK